MRRGLFGKLVLPVLAAGMLVFAVLHVVRAQQAPPNPPPPVEPARTPFGKTVAGAGIVEPETENVSLGSPLPGVVLETRVSVNDVGKVVRQGDLLFQVDDRPLRAQLKYQEAALEAAKAQLAKLEAQPRPEEVPPSEAKVRVARATVDLQRDLSERARRLLPSGSMAQEDVNQRVLSVEVANQQLAQAQADLRLLKAGAWEPDKAIARAAIVQAEAQIVQTKVDLDRTQVRAPMEGKVLQVNVRVGEYVGAPPSQALVVLGSVKKLHVRVDVDEHDIPRAAKVFSPGGTAVASPRGEPKTKIPLRFVRVEPYVIPKKSLTGDNTERVDTRVLQVIYEVERDRDDLYVGMQLDVFIDAQPRPEPLSPASESSGP
jgi:multidrug resistance efflux pump